MIISTGSVKGKEVGFISASYVASKVFYKDFFNSVRNFFGWELKSYTDMLDFARDEALKKLVLKAKVCKANAISNLRFEVSYMANGSLAIMCYGTAVKK